MRDVVSAVIANADRGGTLTMLDGGGVEVRVGWDEVHARARTMATVLTDQDVGPGSRVGLLGDSSIDLVVTVQACWLVGASVTMLAPPMRRVDAAYLDQQRRVCEQARFSLVVVDEVAAAAVPTMRSYVRVTTLVELVAWAADSEPAQVRRPELDDLAVLQYTSGSTSAPRGVPVTHRHLAANLSAITSATRHHPGVRMVSWLPLYHDMGLVGYLILPMSSGCSLTLLSPRSFVARPALWLKALSRYRATNTAAPNFAYNLAAQFLAAAAGPGRGGDAGEAELDLSSLEFVLCGSEPISVTTMERFVATAGAFGLDRRRLVCAYGLAEATLAVTFSPLGTGIRVDVIDAGRQENDGVAVPPVAGGRERRLVRLGSPVLGTEVRVVDGRGTPVRDRHVGEIQVRGPSVVGRYWGEPSTTVDGWLGTGDLGYLAEGDLVVCGRVKDVIFAAGRNLYPQDIEWLVSTSPHVHGGKVAAFGVPDPEARHPDRLVVAVESRQGVGQRDHTVVRDAVTSAVAAGTGLRPSDVVVLAPGRLPKTSSGKLRRQEARRRYLAGEWSARPVPVPTMPRSDQR